MLGMKENLIDMLRTVFTNRQHEAILRASKMEKHIRETEKYEAALANLVRQDKKEALAMEEAGTRLLNLCVDEAYYLGLQDGYTMMQLLTQNEKPYSELMEEARAKIDSIKLQNEQLRLRVFGF